MKNKLNRILTALSLLLLMAANCNPEPDPTPPAPPPAPPNITFSIPSGDTVKPTGDGNASAEFAAGGGTASVTFTATVAWTASSSATWCAVSPASGALGSGTLTLTIAKNETYDERTATVTVTAESVRRTITVKQLATGGMMVSPGTIEVPYGGGDYEIEVQHNVDYKIEVSAEAKSWISVKGTKALTTDKVGIAVSPNDATTSRGGTITFKSSAGEAVVTVKQHEAVYVTVDPEVLTADNTGGRKTVSVRSNSTWKATSSESWCKVSPAEGNGEGTLTVELSTNPSQEKRTATVTVSVDENTVKTVEVTQYGADFFKISPSQVNVVAGGGTFEIAVEASKSYEVTEKPDWVNEVSSANYRHTFSASENLSLEARSGKIIFADARGVSLPCTVTQDGAAPYLTIVSDPLSFEMSGGVTAVSVLSNVKWTVESDASWCEVSPTEGEGDGALCVTVGEYKVEGRRSATLTVRGEGCGSKTFSVEQEGIVPFNVSPSQVEVSADGGTFEVKVTSSFGYHISSIPDWVKEISNTPVNKIHKFEVDPAISAESRSGVVVFCDDVGTCLPVNVRQEGSPDAIDWSKAFYHKSLYMRFTATWCGWCPMMGRSVALAQTKYPGRIELVNLHASSSNLAFSGTETLERQYGIGGYPTGMIDGRRYMGNYSSADYFVQWVGEILDETETAYPVSSAIGFASSFSGRTLSIDLKLYLREAADYKVTVLLTESGIVGYQSDYEQGDHQDYHHDNIARIAVTNAAGDALTTTADRTLKKIHYSTTIPSGYNKDNMKILVIVQRHFGSQRILADGDYGGYYVDNCASGKAGANLKPALGGDAGGGNEDYNNGNPINW